jgi:preprotein translocase subunit SecA
VHIIGWRQRLAHLQGSPVAFDLQAYHQPLGEINRRQDEISQFADQALEARARQLRVQIQAGLRSAEPCRGSAKPSGEAVGIARESVRAALFALAREASWRVLGLRPFDEQVLAAGEGKTLTAVRGCLTKGRC